MPRQAILSEAEARLAGIRRWLQSIGSSTATEAPGAGENLVLFADAEGEYRHVHDQDDSELDDTSSPLSMTRHGRGPCPPASTWNPLFVLCICIGIGWTAGLYNTYPGPTTVPIFIGGAFILASWVVISWTTVLAALARRRETSTKIWSRYSTKYRIWNGLATVLVLWWAVLCAQPIPSYTPPPMIGNGDKYFIAVNLFNSEAIMSDFITELTALVFHLGRHDVFISIYESNSWDGTKRFLNGFDQSLADLGVDHRIVMVEKDEGSQWPYGTSPERIEFLAKCRNRAMEPIQSDDTDVRIPTWRDFTKVVFLNDIRFHWQDIARLILTEVPSDSREGGAPDTGIEIETEAAEGRAGYDMACAMDYGSSGLYDTWVARDLCGTPLRAFWPFVADKPSQLSMRNEEPFRVSACWNGAVVLDAKPFLYDNFNGTSVATSRAEWHIERRGWKMIDDSNYPGARMSPPLASPIRFRTSGIDACDHSECFLLSYDLHRYHSSITNRRPRIIMNPNVKVSYDTTWFHWNTVVLRRPVIQWWRDVWSHRIGYWLFDWPFEHFGRRRDYCTWAGLNIPTEGGRCEPLPGPEERHWDE